MTGTAGSAERTQVSSYVLFPDDGIPVDRAAAEAPLAFLGTVDELSVGEIDAPLEGPPSPAQGRRMAVMTVTEIFRGELAEGDQVALWYGTELAPGTGAEGPPNLVRAPEQDRQYLVLGEPTDLPGFDRVVVPLQGSGLGQVSVDGNTVGLEGELYLLDDLRSTLVAPAEPPAE